MPSIGCLAKVLAACQGANRRGWSRFSEPRLNPLHLLSRTLRRIHHRSHLHRTRCSLVIGQLIWWKVLPSRTGPYLHCQGGFCVLSVGEDFAPEPPSITTSTHRHLQGGHGGDGLTDRELDKALSW